MAADLPPSPRPATIYDVAKRAQVSHETVSRVLRGNPGVKPKNRERVEAALADLNYRPNATAKALATSRSRRIGAMVFDLIEAGPSQFVQGATDAARSAGYLLDIVSVNSSESSVESAIELLNQSDLAGVIAMTPTDHARDAVAATHFGVPVFHESEFDDSTGGADATLNTVGTGMAVEHLIELGHQRIVHIAGPRGWVSARNRANAYRRTMSEHGLSPLPVFECVDWSAAAGYENARSMALDDVTAIFAANDQMAIGALLALHERGVSVPGDISIVGFDDIPESRFVIPPLTTVRLEFGHAGRRAVLALVAEIEGTALPEAARHESVHAQLIQRVSSARVR